MIAYRIKRAIRSSDILARYAGDEFVLYLDSDGNTPLENNDIIDIAESIILSVTKPIDLRNGEYAKLGGSISIAIFPEHGQSYEKLLKSADQAMYLAKERGGNCAALLS